MYEYRARAIELVDGDTFDVVDMGFNMRRRIPLRLKGVDTHETDGVSQDTEEYERGKREANYVREWLPMGTEGEWPLVVHTEEKGKYGHYLAKVVRRRDDAVLNEELLKEFEGIASE